MNNIGGNYLQAMNHYINENVVNPVMESLKKNAMAVSAVGMVVINSVVVTFPSLMLYNGVRGSSALNQRMTRSRFFVASVYAALQAVTVVKIFPVVASSLSLIGISRPSIEKLPERYRVCSHPDIKDNFYACLEKSYAKKAENSEEELPRVGSFLVESAFSSGVSHVVSFISGTWLAMPAANIVLYARCLGRVPKYMGITGGNLKTLIGRTAVSATAVMAMSVFLFAEARRRGHLIA